MQHFSTHRVGLLLDLTLSYLLFVCISTSTNAYCLERSAADLTNACKYGLVNRLAKNFLWPVSAAFPTLLVVCSGEMLMDDDQVLPVAIKELPYESEEDQYRANAELAALSDSQGCPYLAQCYAAFDGTSAVDQTDVIYIVME